MAVEGKPKHKICLLFVKKVGEKNKIIDANLFSGFMKIYADML
jgi:hypothetical protein